MPADTCPYPKPFPSGFRECPAFTPQTYVAFDLHYQPTSAVNTCSHLNSGELPGQVGAYYPRCGLGTGAERLAWVQEVSAERLAGLRQLSAEYREWSLSRMGPLWELKGRMLAARHHGDAADARQAGRELESGLDELLRSAEAFVDARRAQCEVLGLPPNPLKELIRLAIEDWAWSSTLTSGYQVPDELLERFSEPIRLFFTSTRAAISAR
jgi:hypothetical protein